MSGVECNKTMVCGQAVVFSASLSPLSGASHSLALAVALPQKREKITSIMQATSWLKTGAERRIWSKGGVFSY